MAPSKSKPCAPATFWKGAPATHTGGLATGVSVPLIPPPALSVAVSPAPLVEPPPPDEPARRRNLDAHPCLDFRLGADHVPDADLVHAPVEEAERRCSGGPPDVSTAYRSQRAEYCRICGQTRCVIPGHIQDAIQIKTPPACACVICGGSMVPPPRDNSASPLYKWLLSAAVARCLRNPATTPRSRCRSRGSNSCRCWLYRPLRVLW